MALSVHVRFTVLVYGGMLVWNIVPVTVVSAVLSVSLAVSVWVAMLIVWLMRPFPSTIRADTPLPPTFLARPNVGNNTNNGGAAGNAASSGQPSSNIGEQAIQILASRALFTGVTVSTMLCSFVCLDEQLFYGPYGICVDTVPSLPPQRSSHTMETVDCASEWWLMLAVRCAFVACFVVVEHYVKIFPELNRRRQMRLIIILICAAIATFLYMVVLVGVVVPPSTSTQQHLSSTAASRVSSREQFTQHPIPRTFYREDSWFDATRVTVILSCVSMFFRYLLFPVQLVLSKWTVGAASVDPNCFASLLADCVNRGLIAAFSSIYATERMPWLVQMSLLAAGYDFIAAVATFSRYQNILDTFPEVMGNDVDTCVICLEDMASTSPCRRLPCGHFYHRDCLRRWLMEHSGCPVCRQPAHRTAGRTTANDVTMLNLFVDTGMLNPRNHATEHDDSDDSDNDDDHHHHDVRHSPVPQRGATAARRLISFQQQFTEQEVSRLMGPVTIPAAPNNHATRSWLVVSIEHTTRVGTVLHIPDMGPLRRGGVTQSPSPQRAEGADTNLHLREPRGDSTASQPTIHDEQPFRDPETEPRNEIRSGVSGGTDTPEQQNTSTSASRKRPRKTTNKSDHDDAESDDHQTAEPTRSKRRRENTDTS